MKKQIFFASTLMMVLLFSNIVSAGTSIKVGLCSGGEHELYNSDYTRTNVVEDSFIIDLEAVNQTDYPNIEMGLGIEIQPLTALKGTKQSFYFVPVYISTNIYFTSSRIAPYFTGRYGYNLYEGNEDYKSGVKLENRHYYGGGFGLSFFSRRVKLEALYTVNQGYQKTEDDEYKVKFSKTSVLIGYNF